jgi:homoserine kinase type II
MALLTPLTASEVRLAARSVGLEVLELHGLTAGSVNSNFELMTPSGTFFLRLFEEQDRAGAEREAQLLSRLHHAGVPVVVPLKKLNEPGFTSEVHGKPVAIYPMVRGVHRCQATVGLSDVMAVGRALARVHVVGSQLDPREALTHPSRFDSQAVAQRLRNLDPLLLSPELSSARSSLLAELEGVPAWQWRSSEVALIHGDLFRDNVLFLDDGQDSSLALLDFESASIGRIAFDVMVTLLAFCFGTTLDLALARALLDGYEQVRPLQTQERADLFVAGRLACLRFASTRITDYELRARDLGKYKDFRRWLARLQWLEELGQGGLQDSLGRG